MIKDRLIPRGVIGTVTEIALGREACSRVVGLLRGRIIFSVAGVTVRHDRAVKLPVLVAAFAADGQMLPADGKTGFYSWFQFAGIQPIG